MDTPRSHGRPLVHEHSPTQSDLYSNSKQGAEYSVSLSCLSWSCVPIAYLLFDKVCIMLFFVERRECIQRLMIQEW